MAVLVLSSKDLAKPNKISKCSLPISAVNARFEKLYAKIESHIENARKAIQRTVDTEMVNAYWLIGRDIVKEEQQGQKRANYGSYVLKELSKRSREYGKGFGLSTLKDMRQFYMSYPKRPIGHAVRGQSKRELFSPYLGWSHYRALMRVDRIEAHQFYEIEAQKNLWSGRELKRQINSLLYDRLAKSKNKKDLMKLACDGQ